MSSVCDSFRDGGKHGLGNVDDVNEEMGKNKLTILGSDREGKGGKFRQVALRAPELGLSPEKKPRRLNLCQTKLSPLNSEMSKRNAFLKN